MNPYDNVDDRPFHLVLRHTVHFSWRSSRLGESERLGAGKAAYNEPTVSHSFGFLIMQLVAIEDETPPTGSPPEPCF